MPPIQILDTTLRDGSYAVNFSFTTSDTAVICKELEAAGVEWIEIGHGVGFNGSNMGHGEAIHTDEEYIMAAAGAIEKAQWGMFCIPGIARLEDLDMAAQYGMKFIRVGTDVTRVESSRPFIEKAKGYGMTVMANYMKSYAMAPKDFAKQVKLSESYGVDGVYIVDSSGGMFPHQIEAYFNAIREVSELKVGFHGHDNLGLAVSNALYAADLGIELIDTSLQGLGRSAGNASTELVVAALLKKGVPLNINLLKVMEIGKKFIKPLVKLKGKESLDIVAGFADFHSSYMHHIQKFSAKYRVSPELLIIELCKVDKVDVKPDVLEAIAQRLEKNPDLYLGEYNFGSYIGKEQDALSSFKEPTYTAQP